MEELTTLSQDRKPARVAPAGQRLYHSSVRFWAVVLAFLVFSCDGRFVPILQERGVDLGLASLKFCLSMIAVPFVELFEMGLVGEGTLKLPTWAFR